jgi:dTDP-4-dehydrorhamnose 3,5-epimerase-like enzyme
MNIHSKITGELLHIIHRLSEFGEARTDIVPAAQFLQVAAINLYGGQTFAAHKHIENHRTVTHAQESWCVIKGKVKAILYDVDDTVLQEVELNPGDISITLAAGHNYVALEPSLVYEYKTPNYEGQSRDKIMI